MPSQKILEKDLQKMVTDLADLWGWKWTHFGKAQYKDGRWSTPLSGSKGFPDLVLVRPPRLLFIELKSDTGRLSLDQKLWLEILGEAGQEVHMWKPKDLHDGTIKKVLQ